MNIKLGYDQNKKLVKIEIPASLNLSATEILHLVTSVNTINNSQVVTNWYDRNPTAIFQSYLQGLGFHGNSGRWSYTVPPLRKAAIEFLSLTLERIAVTTVPAWCVSTVYYQPNTSAFAATLTVLYLRTNIVGDHREEMIGQTILMNAGDTLSFFTANFDADGQVNFGGFLKGTEFDA